jgi:hypothetical protein
MRITLLAIGMAVLLSAGSAMSEDAEPGADQPPAKAGAAQGSGDEPAKAAAQGGKSAKTGAQGDESATATAQGGKPAKAAAQGDESAKTGAHGDQSAKTGAQGDQSAKAGAQGDQSAKAGAQGDKSAKAGAQKNAGKGKASGPSDEQIADQLKGFCIKWMGFLETRERDNKKAIKWEKKAAGVAGHYVGYSKEYDCTMKERSSNGTPVATIEYKEFVYEKEGASQAEAEQDEADPVEATEVTEIFRYGKGEWVY